MFPGSSAAYYSTAANDFHNASAAVGGNPYLYTQQRQQPQQQQPPQQQRSMAFGAQAAAHARISAAMVWNGPFTSLEYASTLQQVNASGNKGAGNAHHSLQVHRHGLSTQSNTPHFHARQVCLEIIPEFLFFLLMTGRSSRKIVRSKGKISAEFNVILAR